MARTRAHFSGATRSHSGSTPDVRNGVAFELTGAELNTVPALLLAVVLTLFPLAGVAGETQIVDVSALAGRWQGSVTKEAGQDHATMIISADGTYRSVTRHGASTEGMFYLQDGTLRYRSSRTTGTASLADEHGKTVLTMIPAEPRYRTGRAEFERVE